MNNTPLQIAPGKEFRTRDGMKAVITSIIKGINYPARGHLADYPKEEQCWTLNGQWSLIEDMAWDLVAPWNARQSSLATREGI